MTKRAVEAIERRDAAIREAAEAGVSRRVIAKAVGLSSARVQQLIRFR
jgi:ParB-like chromosome segregation protein Spo0J